MAKDLEKIIALENERRIRRAKKYVRGRLTGDRIIWQWPISGPQKVYERTKKLYAATDALTGDKLYLDPKTGEGKIIRGQPVDPVKIDQLVTAPKPPAPDVQHKIITEEIKKPTPPPDPGSMSQQIQRKAAKRQARAVKDVDLSKIKVNADTIKKSYARQLRRAKISARKRYRWKQAAEKRKNFFLALKQSGKTSKVVRSESQIRYQAQQSASKREKFNKVRGPAMALAGKLKEVKLLKEAAAREDYIKNPSRKFFEDAGSFWENLKETGKRFNSKTQLSTKASNLLKKKWFKRGLVGVGSTIAFNLIRDGISRALPQRALPEEYDRGYDILNDTMTDFGSPINLAKAAHKVINPSTSTVRSALRTNVNTIINHNLALASYKNAIRHTQY